MSLSHLSVSSSPAPASVPSLSPVTGAPVLHWADETAFHADDPRRRTSAEVDLGATWRDAGSNDAWRVSWLCDTGELYVCRADGHAGSCTDVSVIAVLGSERELDVLLEGWQEARTDPDGLGWLRSRTSPLAA